MAGRLSSPTPAGNVSSTLGTASTKSANAGPSAGKNGNVIKRLQSELLTLMTSPTPGISAFPAGAEMQRWNATVTGPSDTPYAGLTFKLIVCFPNDYPYAPPDVRFRTPIYHPNVDMSGRICLDILKPAGGSDGAAGGAWSAALNTGSVLLSIQSLLGEPNNSSPLNGEAALLWDRNQAEFIKKVLARHQEPAEMDEN